MANFDTARNVLETSLNSSGSAMKEHEKWSKSLESQLLKLQAAWQSLSQSFLKSDFLKGGISGLTKLLEIIEKLVDNIGTLGTIGLGAGIFSAFKNRSLFKGIIGDFDTFISLIPEAIQSSTTLGGKFKNISKLAGQAGSSISSRFTGSLSGMIGWIGLTVAAIGLVTTAIRNHYEEQSRLRQEVIKTSDEFLESASSFEKAYIKYSGRTNLTTEEESELESAIKGTVDALGDKSSALQNVVNSSNDYVKSLEQIAQAELKATRDAAVNKRDNAKSELIDTAMGWSRLDGSEVNISIKQGSEAYNIAKELDSEYLERRPMSKTEYSYVLSLPRDADVNEIIDYYNLLLEYRDKLSDAELIDTKEYKAVSSTIDEMSESIKVYTDGVYDAAKAEYQLANGIPKTTEEYIKMRESILNSEDFKKMSVNTRSTIANSLDSEYGQIFGLSTAKVQARKLIGVLDEYGDSEARQMETFLNMRTAVNNNECTVGEYMSQFDDIDKMTKNWSKEAKEELNTSFGLDTDTIKQQYEEMEKYLMRQASSAGKLVLSRQEESTYRESLKKAEKDIKEFLNGLSASELSAFISIKTEIDWKNTSKEEILNQIQKEAKFLEAMNYTIAIDIETEGVNALNSAMSESVSAVGLSSESIDALKSRYAELTSQGYDLSTMFEETSNGIHLNRNAVNELEQVYASSKITETKDKLKTLKDRYDELTGKIENCNDASERANLYIEQQSVAQKINDLATLAAQYEGLTSAYNKWQSVESAGSERDMYESIISGFETVQDEISRGWYDDGTIKFLELLTGRTDLATLSATELKEVYKGLDKEIKNTGYSIRDFFTVDEDGNSTNTGVYNFLRAIESFETDGTFKDIQGIENLIKRDENNRIIGFDFNVVGGDEAIAEALGISEELVQIMLRAADDAGFVVTLDGNYTQLADLKISAETANDTLKKLKSEGLDSLKDTDLNFDFSANNLESLNSQLEKAVTVLDKFKDKNGQLKKDENGNLVEGAKEALEIASYFTATIDKLTEPVYMQLETNQVEKELQEPLTKMKEFERLSKEKHQLQLTGDTEELEKVENKMNEIVDYIYENDDLKARLEIEGLSKEEIKSKLEKGEIEIPATVDIQLEMSEDIKDMRLMMMNQLGLITDEQLKLEIEYGVDSSAVEEYTPEQQQAVVEFFAEHDEVDNYTPEEKKAIVKLVAEKDSLDDWSIEDIEAVVKYFVDDAELAEWTPEEKRAFAKYIADGNDVSDYTPEEKRAIAKYIADGHSVDGYTPEDKKALAKYLVDGGDPDNYQPPSKTQQVKAKLDSSEPDNYKPKDKTMTIWAKIKQTFSNGATAGKKKLLERNLDFSEVNGTANIDGASFYNGTSGKAFKQGNWRTKQTKTALTGELGREIIVTPENRWYTVGDYGAEFVNIPRGSIVFNHRQTEELLKYGQTTSDGGRARALVNGTAFMQGTAYSNAPGGGGEESDRKSIVVGTNRVTGEKYTKSTDDAKDDFEELFDLIETAIERIERDINNLDRTANNGFKSWSERSKALVKQISKVREEINLQQKAYKKYMEAAAGTGLSSSWIRKIQNGAVDIATVTDETLAEKIRDYQNYYEAALDCLDAIEELKESEAELYKQRFDNVATQYDGMLSIIEHEKNMLEEYINQSEAQGWIISEKYYEALASNERKNITKLQQEKAALLSELQTAMQSGTIAKGSEEWYEMCSKINDVTLAIEQSNTALLEYAQTVQQLSWERFDLLQEKISAITEESEFLIELMSNKKLYGDNGELTNEGLSTIGLYGVNYNILMRQADQAREEAERLKVELASDPFDTELEARYREMIALQQEYILAAEDAKNAIRDMVENGIEYELDALQEKIDLYNEALRSQKDLYDYQKKISEQTKNIASLEKQLTSYQGDNSEEARKRIQEIKVELENAREDLQETEYDKYISDTEKLLDELYSNYEEVLNTRLDNIDALILDMIEEVNNNASTISGAITESVNAVGYELSDSMQTIWDENTASTNNVITMYGDQFVNAQTKTNDALNAISASMQNMIAQLNSIAGANASAASTSSAVNTPQANATVKPISTENNKPITPAAPSAPTIKVGGKINAGNAQIYDYAGDTSGERQYYRNDPIYVVLKEQNGYLQVRYHKLSSGITGWFKKSDVKAYATGKKNILDDEVAWTQENGLEYIVRPSDGAILTPIAKNDSVLNAQASKNLWSMANSPAEFIRDNLNFNNTNVPNSSNSQYAYTQNLENVTFSFPNVHNYDEMLAQMQKDKNFERLITSMSIDRLAGKSSLAKGKAIR